MLKSESVSGIATNNLVKWDYKAYLRGTLSKCKFDQQLKIRSMCPQDLEEYKYTCEPGHMEWTPLNSNLTMQGIKASGRIQIRKYTNTLEEYKYTSELGHMQRTPSRVGICFSQPNLD